MLPLNWNDPDARWLNITNLALGVIVLLCVAVMLAGIAREMIARLRQRRRVEAEIDRDMQMLDDDHAFLSPKLGITMADGGEKRDV